MKYISTGNPNIFTNSFTETIVNPIPEKNHLWIPEKLPLVKWPNKDEPIHKFIELAVNSITGYNFDFEQELKEVPIYVTHEDNHSFLNLQDGPTLSFKDFGCLCAAKIYKTLNLSKRTIVATSGDTGSAAAYAFSNQNLPITVIFPKNKVSSFQANQMISIEKACVMGIEGDFDKCQQIIKKSIQENKFLTCNSISLARLLPQIGYYAYLSQVIPHVNVIVPSGNLGNATSAYMAKMMGCNINNIIIACNSNDSASRFFNDIDNVFTPKKTVQTIATAMDIGNPSNIVRLWNLVEKNKNNIIAFSVSDEIIKWFIDNENCPHTTVGIVVSYKLKNMKNKCIVRTAAKQKFEKVPINFYPYLKNQNKFFTKFNNIVLVGMPGSGKSTISRCFDKLDSDSEIEKKYNLPLSQIVSSKTFEEFIEIEGNTIVDMLKSYKNKIIATGGSVVYSDHFTINLDNDLVIYLQVSEIALKNRLGDFASRGVFSKSGASSIKDLLHERKTLYEKIADIYVNTEIWDIKRVVNFVKSLKSYIG
jgi:threonine synthase